DGFARLMEQQRRRAQEAGKRGGAAEEAVGRAASRVGRTEFVGYETTEADGRIEALFLDGGETKAAHEGQDVLLLLNRTPFYPEGGGQVGDQGHLRAGGGLVQIHDTKPGPGDVVVHVGRVTSG